jgi:hypothetical protein
MRVFLFVEVSELLISLLELRLTPFFASVSVVELLWKVFVLGDPHLIIILTFLASKYQNNGLANFRSTQSALILFNVRPH